MDRSGLPQLLSPARLYQALRRRGVKGLLCHGLRKVGTKTGRALMGPASLRLTPMGAVCNHACPMCWRQHVKPAELRDFQKADREDGMRLADYVTLFNDMPPGLEMVNLVGGGEPLIHPDALGIMREVKRHGWMGSLISNGTLLKEPIAQAMVAMRWDKTRLSVHAGDAATYHAIHGVDQFATLRANLLAFKRLRQEAGVGRHCELTLLFVLQRANLAAIGPMFEFGEAVGADALVFERIIPHEDADQLKADELKVAQERLVAAARQASIPCNLDEVLATLQTEAGWLREEKPFRPAARCSVGFDETFINSVGEVSPCCFSDEILGDLRNQSFREIWQGGEYRDFRRRLIGGRFAPYCIKNRCVMRHVLHD